MNRLADLLRNFRTDAPKGQPATYELNELHEQSLTYVRSGPAWRLNKSRWRLFRYSARTANHTSDGRPLPLDRDSIRARCRFESNVSAAAMRSADKLRPSILLISVRVIPAAPAC